MFSLGLLLVLQSSTVLVFGLSERSLPRLGHASFEFWGVSLAADRLIGVAVAMGKRAVPIVSKNLSLSELPYPLRVRRVLLRESPEETARQLLAEMAA